MTDVAVTQEELERIARAICRGEECPEERWRDYIDAAKQVATLQPRPASSVRAEALEEAVKFMRHDGLCAIIGGYGYCSCGMEKAREALAEPARGEEG